MLHIDALFSSFAVLQRGKEIRIWGLGDEGSTVTVSVQGCIASSVVNDGKWSVKLPPLTASVSEELTVSDGTNVITINDVAVGEVWIAGGQSNMEFPLRNLMEYRSIKKTNQPLIRLFGVPKISYRGQSDDDDFSEYSIWRPCTPDNLWFYSAAPFYFALKLFETYHIPIGILNCNVGGTQASSWAEWSILEKTGAKIWIDEYNKKAEGLDVEKYAADFKANPMNKTKSHDHSPKHDKMWKGYSDFEMLYMRPRLKAMFKTMPFPPMGPMDRNCPSALYENMVKAIAPFGTRGVIWYQGESDDLHADVYDEAMGAVIDSWRDLWKEDLPFLMVQLAPYEGFMDFPAMHYMVLRAKQEMLSKKKSNVYITNIMDAGMRHDIHPKQKKPVGERLALLAMGKVYHENTLCEAPEAAAWDKTGHRIVITFANCGGGLARHGKDISALNVTVDHKSVKCKVHIEKSAMVLECDAFQAGNAISIKYGIQNFCICNIKNSAGIPVKPFEVVIGEN